MKTLLLFLTLLLLDHSFEQEGNSQLTVKIQNIKKIKGSLKIGVYDHENYFLKKPRFAVDLGVNTHTLIHTFKDLTPGFYALSVFHDENGNDKLDSNFMGIPSEPFGFSNDARGMFGPPLFQDCVIEVRERTKEIVINL